MAFDLRVFAGEPVDLFLRETPAETSVELTWELTLLAMWFAG
jgi:hypothetical protein